MKDMTNISMEIAASPREITRAVTRASEATGVDFDYLMQTAQRESSLENLAKATTSSAAGLFQFIDQTWLDTVKRNGADFGLGDYARAIETRADGRHFVADPAMKEEILAERYNPVSAALMAGALTRGAENRMTTELGRDVSNGELYMSHFLGTSGAIDFIQATEVAPGRQAADLFPKAAAANKSIFYDEAGRSKSMREVYRGLTSKHGDTPHIASPALPGDDIAPPTPRRMSPVRVQVASGYSRPVMQLSPMIVGILASLEAPERANDDEDTSSTFDRDFDDVRARAS